jgi:hypothetical protein
VNRRVQRPVRAALQDHGGLTCTRAIDIQHAAADIDGAADLWETLEVPCALSLLVKKAEHQTDYKYASSQ